MLKKRATKRAQRRRPAPVDNSATLHRMLLKRRIRETKQIPRLARQLERTILKAEQTLMELSRFIDDRVSVNAHLGRAATGTEG